MVQGALFTRDFLMEGIAETRGWIDLPDPEVSAFEGAVRAAFAAFPVTQLKVSEATTEQDLIFKVVEALGWADYITQARASRKGRTDVPDMLLFATAEDKRKAQHEKVVAGQFRHGLVIVENKAWQRPLDRLPKGADDMLDGVPSTQILRYLSLAEVQSERRIQWGVLTNGRHWRLYFQGARSRSEEFLELDLPAILGIDGIEGDLFAPKPEERRHWLKVFLLLFRRASFLADGDGHTFHQAALAKGRMWEERVRQDLSQVVFDKVFPDLVRALAGADPARPVALDHAYLEEVRQGALTLLYRLLFLLYAEDRNLLPADDARYDDYSLRDSVRDPVAKRRDKGDAFSERADAFFNRFKELCRIVDQGDASVGIPPYNGGLFDASRTPLLERARLPDAAFAPLVDRLSRHEQADGTRRWINYRDLQVKHLGSIYERLLEFDLTATPEGIVIRPNIFARKGSGSYYTPDELVELILVRTVGPLLDERLSAFKAVAEELASSRQPKTERLERLAGLDPASAMLDIRVCDPAMGSGHFLVSLVDYLADRILEAVAEAEHSVPWADEAHPYRSPLSERIATIREHIRDQAAANGWTVAENHLDDRLIVRRMILKRVVFGVDKNPMAVELAKVALWLHTFTVGAPLSFLDHHLRCGDSLFGERVRPVEDALAGRGGMFLGRSVSQAKQAAKGMAQVEQITDADIAEVRNSKEKFDGVMAATEPLYRFLDLFHARRWLADESGVLDAAFQGLLDSQYGDPIRLAAGEEKPIPPKAKPQPKLIPDGRPEQQELPVRAAGRRGRGRGRPAFDETEAFKGLVRLLDEARALAAEERFLHWEVAFPGVWEDWESATPKGGFDAVIGNPPWDRMKLQKVEWFAARRPEIAMAQRASDREKMTEALQKASDPLWRDYEKAGHRAETAAAIARTLGDYPLLSGGDVNLYSLFVERAFRLVRPEGMVGLLVPSGIASDKGASDFFASIATTGRLAALIDFENRRQGQPDFFPDVDGRFKFCAFVAGGPERRFAAAACAFFLHGVEELADDGRAFALTADDFTAVNPNTGTAPVFRTARDAAITTAIYSRLPVLVDRRDTPPKAAWPVRYSTMFHMTNDSRLFKTRAELEKAGFYPVEGNRWKKGDALYVPLYEGKMVQAYDHRAASVVVNPDNLHRPAQPEPATEAQHVDPAWLPAPQFWIPVPDIRWPSEFGWMGKGSNWTLGFKDVTAPTNARTMIASIVPHCAAGNTLPLILPLLPEPPGEGEQQQKEGSDSPMAFWERDMEEVAEFYRSFAPLLLANLNSLALDYVARQKVQGQHLNWYIVEQLPVVPEEGFSRQVGKKTAAEIARAEVLKLTYTAHDMKLFARDMGYDGPPFAWDEEERRHSRARLDALFFLLYGIEEADATYILETFPIVREQDEATFGRFRTKDLVLGYLRAFKAGDIETRIVA